MVAEPEGPEIWPTDETPHGDFVSRTPVASSGSAPLTAPPGFRSGFVALVGRPNVGKSTLVNRILGRKVSITADTPQTTRHRVAGVLSASDYQLILLDMPGFQKPRDALTRRMQDLVDATISEVDAVLFVLDGTGRPGRGDTFIARALATATTPVLAVVNKADLLDADDRRRAEADVAGLLPGVETHLLSALDGTGVERLGARVAALLPEGPLYFPRDVVTDQPEEVLIAEFIREKLIAVTAEELPHAIAVQVLEMEMRGEGEPLYIRAAVYVERDSQKPIVLGRGGSVIKQVGTEARRDVEWLLGTHVYLDLVVKVRKHWRKDTRMLDTLGL
ncbi:MAG: GTPase Era [Thermoleophilia bacterium]